MRPSSDFSGHPFFGLGFLLAAVTSSSRGVAWAWAVFGFALGSSVLQARAAEGVTVPARVVEAPPPSASPPVRPNLLRLDAMDTVLGVALPGAEEERRAAMAEDPGMGPLRIGVHRVLPDQHRGNLAPRLRWVTDPEDGSVSAAMTVTSPNALRIRLGIRARLPRGAEIRFFHGSPPTVVGTMSPRDFATGDDAEGGPNDDVRWSPSAPGDTLGIEIMLPSSDEQYGTQVEIHRVSHQYRPARPTETLANSSDLECSHVDVRCRDVGNKLHAVGKIVYETGRESMSCSGTLVGNTDERFYFLTANHCISTASEARSLEGYWYWQSDRCGSTTTDPQFHVTSGGADLLATSVAQDTTLLELRNRPRARVLLSGWSSNPRGAGVEVYGIHHPGDEFKKYLKGTTGDAVDSVLCYEDDNCYTVERSIPVTITDGAAEGGSSGSGLFDGVHLIGVLAGGSSCRAKKYGRFSDFFPRVQRWLAPGPDLVVSSLEADSATVEAGASFTLTALVRNRGNRTADRTTLRYYRSDNATISSRDVLVGTDRISALDPGESDGERIDVTAPNSAGTYYYGACVDAVPNESVRSNNCSAGVRVTVELDCGDDDHGDRRTTATSIDLDVSVNGEICPHDDKDNFRFEIPTSGRITAVVERSTGVSVWLQMYDSRGDPVGFGGNSRTESLAPVEAGSYYVEAKNWYEYSDDDVGSYTLSVSYTPGPSDLVVESPRVDPTTVDEGAEFTFSALVRNRGVGAAEATTLRYHPDALDRELGSDPVRPLDAGASSSESIRLTAPSTAGSYRYGACADWTQDEVDGYADASNNCSDIVQLTVEGRPATSPDLVVESPGVDQTTITAGTSFTLSARVRNRGDGTADATTLHYYQSTDATISSNDTAVGTNPVEQLVPEASSSESIRLTAPDVAGTYYYGACVDAVAGENTPSNNCSNGVRVTVEEAGAGTTPDLVVDAAEVDVTTVEAGAIFTLAARVRNRGDGTADATTLHYYQSTDATISSNDTAVGTDPVEQLVAEASSSEFIRLTAPDAVGTHYYGACVDAVAGESVLANNCSSSVRVTVEEAGAGGDDHGDSEATATKVLENSATPGSLERGGDRDFFRIDLGKAGALEVETTGSTDTYGVLAREDGGFRAENDDGSPPDRNFRIADNAAQPGVYFVEVRGYRSSTTGAYELRVSFEAADPATTPDPATTSRLGDVNGDGRADVLLRHADTGHWIYYAMGQAGGRLVRRLGLTPNTKWALAGVGDFNGDGHDDVLVRHTESGQWLYYAMDGAGGRPVRRLGLTPNMKWALAGVGDFNDDGYDDVLVRHTESGQWLYYAMDGAAGRLVRRLGLTPNMKWALAGVGDFNGDGYDDVLVRHTESGQWIYYAMDGAGGRLVRRLGLTPNAKWTLAGVGDFDGDGYADVLLRHGDTGNWIYYAMDGVGGRLVRNFGATRNRLWAFAGVGDVNGDGRDDIVLRHGRTGSWVYYAMEGDRSRLVRNLGLTTNRDWIPLALARAFRDCPDCPEMMVIPAGSFRMGCLSGAGDCVDAELPVHQVRIPRPFALSVHEVTFAQWDACVAVGGCGGYRPADTGWGRGDRPVINVSWEDAGAYASWLSSRTGHAYRLPSESEWEYAARADTTTKYWWGDDIGVNRTNCGNDHSCEDPWPYTAPVGSFAPNGWGLYDMHGNVWEWTGDCWNGSYDLAPSDGSAWETSDCTERVSRGGSWGAAPWYVRSAVRRGNGAGDRGFHLGFRVARTLTR